MTGPRDRLHLASELIRGGQWTQAAAELQRFLSRDPRHAAANGMMAYSCSRLGEPRRAVFFLERALAADTANLDYLHNLANAHLALGAEPQALRIFERINGADPRRLSSAISLTALLCASGRIDESEAKCRELLAHSPHCVPLLCNLAAALRAAGRSDEAAAVLRDAERIDPSDPQTASSLAQTLTYLPEADAAARLAAHRRCGMLLNAAAPRASSPPVDDRDPERRLRVGIVSADFREHSVAFFAEPWLAHRERRTFSLTCYSAVPLDREDATTRRLRAHADEWRHLTAAVTHIQTAEMIRADRIDILVDLSGHTMGNRLPVFALRPAPLQITYLGYPDTTGLERIDWRLVDCITDPPGAEAFTAERLWRLDPCFLCYRPPGSGPEPARAETGSVTFGSFNSIAKLNAPTLDLWAHVLLGVPRSHLLLKSDGLGCAGVRDRVHRAFAARRIPPDRVELLPRSPSAAEHLACYNRVDIALDPTPYNGTTTTCEALHMGVPVVTLTGSRHAARVGTSLLTAAGLPELIAADESGYTRIAAALASDAAERSRLRSDLRATIARSVLCDAPGFTRRLEQALRAMWRAACASSPWG